jgi:hypothetical protein
MEGYTAQDFLRNLSYMKGEGNPGGTSGFDVDDFVAPDILSPRRPDNSAKIEQITRRLAEIREEKKALDTEKEMAEYKYLYEADPSAYMNLMHNRKTAEQTEQIRKGSEEATRQANLQSAYKENSNGLMVARYDLSEAENAYREAQASGDPERAEKAYISLKRARANYDKLAKENGVLRERVMKAFGLSQENPEKPAEVAPEATPEDSAHAESVKNLRDYQGALAEISVLANKVKTDNMPVSKAEKAKRVKELNEKVDALQATIDNAKVGTAQKAEAQKQLDSLREQVRTFSKPSAKGGQGTKKTVEDYQAVLDSNPTTSMLVALGYNYLVNAKKAGAKNPNLDKAISKAMGGK